MDLMIPGSVEFVGGHWAWLRESERRALEENLRILIKAELWRRCEAAGTLGDLPSYRVSFRARGRGVICEAELVVNGSRARRLGCGARPEEALRDALGGEFCPIPWGVASVQAARVSPPSAAMTSPVM